MVPACCLSRPLSVKDGSNRALHLATQGLRGSGFQFPSSLGTSLYLGSQSNLPAFISAMARGTVICHKGGGAPSAGPSLPAPPAPPATSHRDVLVLKDHTSAILAGCPHRGQGPRLHSPMEQHSARMAVAQLWWASEISETDRALLRGRRGGSRENRMPRGGGICGRQFPALLWREPSGRMEGQRTDGHGRTLSKNQSSLAF